MLRFNFLKFFLNETNIHMREKINSLGGRKCFDLVILGIGRGWRGGEGMFRGFFPSSLHFSVEYSTHV